MNTPEPPPVVAAPAHEIAAATLLTLGAGLVGGGLVAKFGRATGVIWLGAVALGLAALLGFGPDKSL